MYPPAPARMTSAAAPPMIKPRPLRVRYVCCCPELCETLVDDGGQLRGVSCAGDSGIGVDNPPPAPSGNPWSPDVEARFCRIRVARAALCDAEIGSLAY